MNNEKFCNFGFAESTHVRKNSNLFGFSLTYSYLCHQKGKEIWNYT